MPRIPELSPGEFRLFHMKNAPALRVRAPAGETAERKRSRRAERLASGTVATTAGARATVGYPHVTVTSASTTTAGARATTAGVCATVGYPHVAVTNASATMNCVCATRPVPLLL